LIQIKLLALDLLYKNNFLLKFLDNTFIIFKYLFTSHNFKK